MASASNYMGEHGSDKDMERALEHQAQLIGQYEEEEKAQREWEEKFRENNNSTPVCLVNSFLSQTIHMLLIWHGLIRALFASWNQALPDHRIFPCLRFEHHST